MQRYFLKFLIVCCAVISATAFAPIQGAEPPSNAVGIVSFPDCIMNSKYGKEQQAEFETLKKQLSSLLEETEKQLNDISTKLNDTEYLDSLSPEAEEDLKTKFQSLNDDLNRYQGQYYQVLNQANMRIIQMMTTRIGEGSEQVAKDKKLNVVINKDACFYCSPKLDVTSVVIAEMDKRYDAEAKNREENKKNEESIAQKGDVVPNANTPPLDTASNKKE
jgi:outer membrane protein